MANYATLQAAIDAGTTNMTVNPNRNNAKNDSGTDALATDITWFYFTSIQATNIYASGDSGIGFGAASEQLKVNRRDGAVWTEYTETGMIGANKFFKLRWIGYCVYNQTSDAYLQRYDVFLLDNGQIFLSFFDVPTSSCDGTNALVCGSTTITYTVTAGTACEYTFTPSDPAAGTGWSVASGRPNLAAIHKTSGNAIYTIADITGVITTSALSWAESKPSGTTVTVSVSTDGTNYTAITNGGVLLGAGTYSNQMVYVKVDLSTTDVTATPSVGGINYSFSIAEDTKSIVLEMQPLERFESAAGNIAIAYDGLGTLAGAGGPVAAFTQSFAPGDLIPKPDQNDQEHINIASIAATSNLMRIYYTNACCNEHINIASITAVGTLTNINDL